MDLEEKNGNFLPELEGRINLEHLAYSIKGVINGKCYTGIGPLIQIGGDGILNLHGGFLYFGPRQSSLYILDTDEPQLNPYDSELRKHYYGVAANFEGERSKWGLRFLYNIQILNLKSFIQIVAVVKKFNLNYMVWKFFIKIKKIHLFII